MDDDRFSEVPLIEGTVLGLVTWAAGYAVTYALVAPDVRDSSLNRFIELFEGEPAEYEMVGWVFYNAHFVATEIRDLPVVGNRTTSFISGDGFSELLYAVPPALLIIGGFLLSWYSITEDPLEGALAGMTLVPGYLVLSVAGIFLFEVSLGGASGSPLLVTGILIAGLMYPIFWAGIGGAVSGLLSG